MTSSLLVALLLAASPAPRAGAKAPAPPPPAAPQPAARREAGPREVRTIPLNERQATRVHVVRTAPSYPATIEFPEAFAAPPACGDCGDKGLFRLDVFSEGHYLTIKPRTYAGAQPDGSTIGMADFVTVLTVRLQSFTLTIQVEYVDDSSKADPRIIFTVPDRQNESAYVRAEIAKARKALEDEIAGRIDAGVQQGFLQALAQPHACSRSSLRTRSDDLVVEVAEVCYFGPSVYARITIENRGRTPAEVAELLLRRGTGAGATPLDDTRVYLPQPRIEFQTSTVAVVGAQVAEGEEGARSYELVLRERGGRNRTVTVSGLTF